MLKPSKINLLDIFWQVEILGPFNSSKVDKVPTGCNITKTVNNVCFCDLKAFIL